MRKRYWIVAGFAAVLLPIPLCVVCLGRSDTVNSRAASRLRLGMTEKEVEEVLGRPADSKTMLAREESGQVKQHAAKEWLGPVRTVRIAFNDDGASFMIVEGQRPLSGPFDSFRRMIDGIREALDF